mmetsp:Transcript_33120/g.84074  ORF Transcript_33120/g.84074 Transcript_33120/m.84074 type:complete len:434 (+) Transcript_33120:3485-4786(+)
MPSHALDSSAASPPAHAAMRCHTVPGVAAWGSRVAAVARSAAARPPVPPHAASSRPSATRRLAQPTSSGLSMCVGRATTSWPLPADGLASSSASCVAPTSRVQGEGATAHTPTTAPPHVTCMTRPSAAMTSSAGPAHSREVRGRGEAQPDRPRSPRPTAACSTMPPVTSSTLCVVSTAPMKWGGTGGEDTTGVMPEEGPAPAAMCTFCHATCSTLSPGARGSAAYASTAPAWCPSGSVLAALARAAASALRARRRSVRARSLSSSMSESSESCSEDASLSPPLSLSAPAMGSGSGPSSSSTSTPGRATAARVWSAVRYSTTPAVRTVAPPAAASLWRYTGGPGSSGEAAPDSAAASRLKVYRGAAPAWLQDAVSNTAPSFPPPSTTANRRPRGPRNVPYLPGLSHTGVPDMAAPDPGSTRLHNHLSEPPCTAS